MIFISIEIKIEMLYQLVAYTKTGKDTLYNNLDNFVWDVYSDKEDNLYFSSRCSNSRIAFADKLKVMVCTKLKMDQIENPSEIHPLILPKEKMTVEEWIPWLDVLKDLKNTNIQLNGKETFRRYLIDYATRKKEKHGNSYFVDLVYKDVINKLHQGINVFITDTRYPYEVFKEGVTIRMFRSEVIIPSCHSERSMDNYKCDYVFCMDDKDFEILKEIQPQYKYYQKRNY